MREPPDPNLLKQHEDGLVEISYESKQAGSEKIVRGQFLSLHVRGEGESYRLEIHDEVNERYVVADTAQEQAFNHRSMVLGELLEIDVYGRVA